MNEPHTVIWGLIIVSVIAVLFAGITVWLIERRERNRWTKPLHPEAEDSTPSDPQDPHNHHIPWSM